MPDIWLVGWVAGVGGKNEENVKFCLFLADLRLVGWVVVGEGAGGLRKTKKVVIFELFLDDI